MAWRVFYSYSHKDFELRERLATYLAPLRHQGKISEWHDRKIEPGLTGILKSVLRSNPPT